MGRPHHQILRRAIRELADDIAAAKAPFIVQGWGPQRHTNGEDASRAICMLPILIGKFGLPGTNTGSARPSRTSRCGGLPAGENPVKASIPLTSGSTPSTTARR